MEHTKHLWRALILVIAFLLAFVFGRHFLVPETFGDDGGYFRAASRLEFMALPLVHGVDRKACAECHAKQQEEHDGGKHVGVNCEVCHAPMAEHASQGKKTADMPVDRSRSRCELCHLKLRARPATFSQIETTAHLVAVGAIENGDPLPDGGCIVCHPPHNPEQK